MLALMVIPVGITSMAYNTQKIIYQSSRGVLHYVLIEMLRSSVVRFIQSTPVLSMSEQTRREMSPKYFQMGLSGNIT